MIETPPTQEAALAPVYVYWDIKRCPVPDGYDARQVGPCIKRILNKVGYNGNITITVVGSLSEVPRDILEALSSTGISLYHEPRSCKDMISLYYTRRYLKFPPPINMMFISRQPRYIPPNFYPLINDLKEIGYNLIFPFPLDSPQEASSTRVKCLWKEFLLADPRPLEEDRCGETGEPALWVCTVCPHVCDPPFAGQGVDNFITHISTAEHELRLQRVLAPNGVAPLDSYPENATRGPQWVGRT